VTFLIAAVCSIRHSTAADWKSAFGSSDDNRVPHVLAVEPGTYAVEKINARQCCQSQSFPVKALITS
jgi:hypothetical protein